jgi:Na+/H+-translocating membrane pyrophosphatase
LQNIQSLSQKQALYRTKKSEEKSWQRFRASQSEVVSDLFKATADSALNPMTKVVNLVSVIISPIVVQYAHATGATQYAI